MIPFHRRWRQSCGNWVWFDLIWLYAGLLFFHFPKLPDMGLILAQMKKNQKNAKKMKNKFDKVGSTPYTSHPHHMVGCTDLNDRKKW